MNITQIYPQVHISQIHCSFSAAVIFGFGFLSSVGCLRGPSFVDVVGFVVEMMMSSRVLSVSTVRSTTSNDSFYIEITNQKQQQIIIIIFKNKRVNILSVENQWTIQQLI